MKMFLKSRNIKRNLGSAIVILPMVLRYAMKHMGADGFEIDDDLLNILYAVGGSIWTVGVLHAYLPLVLKWTLRIEKSLEAFNKWAAAKIKKGGK